MKAIRVTFCEIYLEPGASYSFSSALFRELDKRLSCKMLPSEALLAKYPKVTTLEFTLSASAKLKTVAFRKGDLIKKGTIAEYLMTLPYSPVDTNRNRRAASGLRHLVLGINRFFSGFGMKLPNEWDAAEIVAIFKGNTEKYLYDMD